MTFSPACRLKIRRAARGLALAAVLAAPAALAQGTDEQREACAPDAVKLCEDTIPDVPKTTACMKRHYAQLSPRCRVAFDSATGGSSKPRNRTAKREDDAPPAGSPRPDTDVEAADAAPESVAGIRAYEARIRQICRDGLVDAFTCRNTLDALKASE